MLRQAVAVSPRSFVANFHLGRVLLTVDRLQEADKFLHAAADLAPQVFPDILSAWKASSKAEPYGRR